MFLQTFRKQMHVILKNFLIKIQLETLTLIETTMTLPCTTSKAHFAGDSADTFAGKFPLMLMEGRANSQTCADGERGPPSA